MKYSRLMVFNLSDTNDDLIYCSSRQSLGMQILGGRMWLSVYKTFPFKVKVLHVNSQTSGLVSPW